MTALARTGWWEPFAWPLLTAALLLAAWHLGVKWSGTDVFPSPLDPNTVFVTLNNWQTGDYKPYIVKSTDRGRTFTNITGNLTAKNDLWSVIQDHVNPNLLFVGAEFGVFVSVDGGRQWTQLKGGLPTTQVRDMQVQKRENDLVLGTFGRSFYILDDYSPLREITAQSLAEEARLYPVKNPWLIQLGGIAQRLVGFGDLEVACAESRYVDIAHRRQRRANQQLERFAFRLEE